MLHDWTLNKKQTKVTCKRCGVVADIDLFTRITVRKGAMTTDTKVKLHCNGAHVPRCKQPKERRIDGIFVRFFPRNRDPGVAKTVLATREEYIALVAPALENGWEINGANVDEVLLNKLYARAEYGGIKRYPIRRIPMV